MTPTEWLQLGVQQYLREMDDTEFAELTAKVRPPKSARYPAKKRRKAVHPSQTPGGGNSAQDHEETHVGG